MPQVCVNELLKSDEERDRSAGTETGRGPETEDDTQGGCGDLSDEVLVEGEVSGRTP